LFACQDDSLAYLLRSSISAIGLGSMTLINLGWWMELVFVEECYLMELGKIEHVDSKKQDLLRIYRHECLLE
jgi:hypothetical protein